MMHFDNYQENVILELSRIKPPNKVDLCSVLFKFLPDDLYIGEEPEDDNLNKIYLLKYRINEMNYVQSVLSVKISSFITLIKELTNKEYLIKVKNDSDKKLAIGRLQYNNSQYARYRLGSNLTYEKIREIFVDSDYYSTENLQKLPSYEFLEPNDYISLKNLRYTRILIIIAIGALIVDIMIELIPYFIKLIKAMMIVIGKIVL